MTTDPTDPAALIEAVRGDYGYVSPYKERYDEDDTRWLRGYLACTPDIYPGIRRNIAQAACDHAAALADALEAARGEVERLRGVLTYIATDAECSDRGVEFDQGDKDCLTYYPTSPREWCISCVAVAALDQVEGAGE